MVTPANRLHGMRSLASSLLGPGLGSVASGVGKAAMSAVGSGVHAAGDTFGKLSTLGDLNQMQQLQLQDSLQKAGQAFQLLSNVTKSVHETAQSVIRNMR